MNAVKPCEKRYTTSLSNTVLQPTALRRARSGILRFGIRAVPMLVALARAVRRRLNTSRWVAERLTPIEHIKKPE
jgi:hypothetical protein